MKKVAWWLTVIGALNWGLIGLGAFFSSNWNVINLLVGQIPYAEAIVYLLVGISAVVALMPEKKGMPAAEPGM